MNVVEIRMLRRMCGHAINDRIRNEIIREKVKVTSIEVKMRKNLLCLFEHIQRRPEEAPVMRIEGWRYDRLNKGKGRPKKIWIEVIKRDMFLLDLDESMTMNKNKWKEMIHLDNHT
jgi:hypothetical protein